MMWQSRAAAAAAADGAAARLLSVSDDDDDDDAVLVIADVISPSLQRADHTAGPPLAAVLDQFTAPRAGDQL